MPGPDGEEGGTAVGMLPGGGFVVLDTHVTPALAATGLANDVVRLVQQARRDAGLAISDRIRLTIAGEGPVWEAVVNHQELLVTETLADSVGATGDLDQLPAGRGCDRGSRGRRSRRPGGRQQAVRQTPQPERGRYSGLSAPKCSPSAHASGRLP